MSSCLLSSNIQLKTLKQFLNSVLEIISLSQFTFLNSTLTTFLSQSFSTSSWARFQRFNFRFQEKRKRKREKKKKKKTKKNFVYRKNVDFRGLQKKLCIDFFSASVDIDSSDDVASTETFADDDEINSKCFLEAFIHSNRWQESR